MLEKGCGSDALCVQQMSPLVNLELRSTGSALHLVQNLGYFIQPVKVYIDLYHLLLNIVCLFTIQIGYTTVSINLLRFYSHILCLMQSAASSVMFLPFIC